MGRALGRPSVKVRAGRLPMDMLLHSCHAAAAQALLLF